MGVVIDVNTIPSIFNKSIADHDDFKPLLHWLIVDKAKLIIGGTHYLIEMHKLHGYMMFISELNKVGKVHKENNKDVDDLQLLLKNKEPRKKFNDPHIAALLTISGSKIFCIKDASSFKFIKNACKFNSHKVYIFTNYQHKPQVGVLNDDNLSTRCDPHFMLPKHLAKYLLDLIEN